jgi:nitrile hydratase subunit beta
MNGPHDQGGAHGFGPIAPEPNEPVFHSAWERRAFATNLAMGMTGTWNIDKMRHARERVDPATYWASSYYEMRHYGLVIQLIEDGLVTAEEVASGKAVAPPKPVKRVARAAMIPEILAGGGPANRTVTQPPRFRVGDKIRTRTISPTGHTRLPRYLMNCGGEIAIHHGAHVLPDSNGHGLGEDPQHLYTVRFRAAAVFGIDSRDELHADLFEPYLVAP